VPSLTTRPSKERSGPRKVRTQSFFSPLKVVEDGDAIVDIFPSRAEMTFAPGVNTPSLSRAASQSKVNPPKASKWKWIAFGSAAEPRRLRGKTVAVASSTAAESAVKAWPFPSVIRKFVTGSGAP